MRSYPTRADLKVPYHEQQGQDGAFATFDHTGRLVRLEHWHDGTPMGHALDVDHRTHTVMLTQRTLLAPSDHDDANSHTLFRDAIDVGISRVWDDLDHARRLRCAFCEKRQHEVARLIAGPTSYICDECIRLCAEIISDGA